MALRRANEGGVANILDYIPKNVTLLPNTSGARNAEEAVRIARLDVYKRQAEQIGDHERGKSRNENHDDSADHAGECQRKDNADQYDP